MGFCKNFSFFVAFAAILTGLRVKSQRDIVGPSGFGWRSTAEDVVSDVKSLKGKVAIITGANSGLGLEAARVLAWKGMHVVVAARSIEKAEGAIEEIKAALLSAKGGVAADYTLSPLVCDLSSIASIEAAAADFKGRGLPLHFLVNNAGVMGLQKEKRTVNGLEMQMGVNHIGHFHLTNLLMDTLTASQPSRVIILSSGAHKMAELDFLASPELERDSYDPFPVYGNTKFANILHAKELTTRYASQGVRSYSLHPGGISTNLARDVNPVDMLRTMGTKIIGFLPYMKDIPQGTATTLYAMLKAPDSEAGAYYEDVNVSPIKGDVLVQDSAVRKRFWEQSERIVAAAQTRLSA